MSRFLTVVTQSGADTATSVAIDTQITPDGKTGINILAMEVYWDPGETAPASDWEISGILQTVSTTPTAAGFNTSDEICRVSWGCQNTAGVAVALTLEPIKQIILFEPRITAQPLLYFFALSNNTGLANILRAKIYYETVKLTDVELLRLLVGGA